MEIKAVKPTAEVRYQIKAEVPQALRLVVRFAGLDQAIDHYNKDSRPSDINRWIIAASIVEWDLTENGVPIPVTEENKKLYVPYIASAQTVDGEVVGWLLVEFIRDQANFLKN